MKIIKTIEELNDYHNAILGQGTLGFVPTMGALHQGHVSLIEQSAKENTFTICSIFVNPTQFNDPADLKKYPRTIEKDIAILEQTTCNALFFPNEELIYPKSPDPVILSARNITDVMEGKFRPGHFQGVMMVVKRLFELIKPNKAYFGQKDFQQLAVVKQMVKELSIPVSIIGCPIVRETDGLAMSSRNVHLNDKERKNATEIFQTLLMAKKMINEHESFSKITALALERLKAADLDPEYFEISNPLSLVAKPEGDFSLPMVVCLAAFCGKTRLLDNILLD